MTAVAATTKPPSRPAKVTGDDGVVSRAAARLLPFVPLIQAALTVVGLAVLVAIVVAGPRDLAPPLFLFVLAVPLLFAVGAGLSTIWTLRRTSRGRVLAIIVDYLAFLAAFLLLLHLLGVFVGFDDLADVFGGTLPWLALALLAFLLGTRWTRSRAVPARSVPSACCDAGLLIVAAVGGLAAIDAAHGASEMLRDLADPLIFALAIVSIVLLAFIVALWGPAAQRRFGATLREGDVLFGVLLISPALLGFLGFFAGPLLFSLYVSMSEWDAFSEPVFTGLQNYLDIVALQFLVLDDPNVLLGSRAPGRLLGDRAPRAARGRCPGQALLDRPAQHLRVRHHRHPLAVIPALFVASLLNTKLRGIRVFRAIYFIPSVAGVVGHRDHLEATAGPDRGLDQLPHHHGGRPPQHGLRPRHRRSQGGVALRPGHRAGGSSLSSSPGRPSGSTPSSSWPVCRVSRRTSTRQPPSTARIAGSAS